MGKRHYAFFIKQADPDGEPTVFIHESLLQNVPPNMNTEALMTFLGEPLNFAWGDSNPAYGQEDYRHEWAKGWEGYNEEEIKQILDAVVAYLTVFLPKKPEEAAVVQSTRTFNV